jgi:glycosyltransferase involved in cell wall biosynthesis
MQNLSEISDPCPAAVLEVQPARKVKIAYLLSLYPARSITFILNEIIGLRRLGFDIVTASINSCDSSTAEKEAAECHEEASTFYVKAAGVWRCALALIETILLYPAGFMRGLAYTARLGGGLIRFFYFLEALVVGMWMRREGRNHLHVHFGGAVASVGMLVARVFSVKLSITMHGPDEFWDAQRHYLKQKIETASFVCCISSFGKSQLMLHTSPDQWDKIVVARLGVDVTRFSSLRNMGNLSEDPPEIVCVGRLVGAKGQGVLLRAMRQLIEEGHNVRLRFIGYGPQREHLEAICLQYGLNQHVIFEGSATSGRVNEALENATIFCLPSFAEGIPIALMEAMSMQVPCVSTTVAGIPELIRNGIDGLLVTPADDSELADALRTLLTDPELRRRLGASARKRVLNHYNLHESLENLKGIFLCH